MSFASETTTYKPGSCYGRIVVIKRNGQDSASFDLTDASYLFGSSPVCDIRIQLATIDSEHCRVSANAQGQVCSRGNHTSNRNLPCFIIST